MFHNLNKRYLDVVIESKSPKHGGLAQLARALDLHSRGQRFDSVILHKLVLKDLRSKDCRYKIK